MDLSKYRRHITLGELLFTLQDHEIGEGHYSNLTYLDTSDESFPEKYRSEHIHYAFLFAKAIESNDESILDRTINSMRIAPLKHIKVNERDIYVDKDRGYLAHSYNDTKPFELTIGNIHMLGTADTLYQDISIPIALEIVLDDETTKEEE